MNALLVSLVRTIVPVLTGLFIATALEIGMDVDSESLSSLLDALVVGSYYALVRFAEQRYPVVGWVLGLPMQPVYGQEPDTAELEEAL
jgi:hypothetical protein